jgi:hypothetical protein
MFVWPSREDEASDADVCDLVYHRRFRLLPKFHLNLRIAKPEYQS